MSATWVVQNTSSFNSSELIASLGMGGREVLQVSDKMTPEVDARIGHQALAIYASPRFINSCRDVDPGTRFSLADYLIDDWDLLRRSSYYGTVYPWLGRPAVFLPIGALEFAEVNFWGESVVVSPDSPFKPFDAARRGMGELKVVAKLYPGMQRELAVLSPFVDMGQIYRCIVSDGEVVASSSYPPPYQKAPDQVVAFATVVAKALLAKDGIQMACIDVSAVQEKDKTTLKLAEVNGVNSCALYGCDKSCFMLAMEHQVQAKLGDTFRT